ncbi:MAG: polysaccharide biosynthesis tyrosine autokinase [Flavobacterium sp.]
MIDTKDFAFMDGYPKFDFKGFINRIIGYWYWFVLCWIIAYTIAYQVNARKQKVFALDTTIAVKEESNPFFTSNTSLVFNWGGTSDQVQNIMTTIRSRTHNEMVVERLEFYIDYLQQGKYHLEDVYGTIPFYFQLDKSKGQLAGKLVEVKVLPDNFLEVTIDLSTQNQIPVHIYQNHTIDQIAISPKKYTYKIATGKKIQTPFLNGTFWMFPDRNASIGSTYMIRFNSLDGTVGGYRRIKVETDVKAGSVIRISLDGNNKKRIVDYLNATVKVLMKRQLDRKNQFANNTINFIDSTLAAIDNTLKDNQQEIQDFTRNKNILEIENGGSQISSKLLLYETEKEMANRKLAYYNNLKTYLNSRTTDFSKLPVPAVAGIDDPNIVTNVSKLISLSNDKTEMAYTRKNKILFEGIDNEMESLKKIILENIQSAKSSINYDLNLAQAKINQLESSIKKLPEDQQEYLKITRKYKLNDNIFTTFLAKRNEANIVKAANLSDIHFIDSAKDTGGGQIGPDTNINYILALIFGGLTPLILIFLFFFVDTSILKIEDITNLTKIPIIGVIGIKNTDSNLSVYEKPKSALSESFRAVRSSLQFLYKKQEKEGAKTLMLTSTISGEGKTFCSLNIATVFALSERKTIVIGLDLRKPKIFNDFDINNDSGVVNYLIGQKKIQEVIQPTKIPNLDVITSGPIPPNPSELLMSDSLGELIDELKQKYDYIILDTPPVGLVTDALQLTNFADVILYVIRQKTTKKEMVTLLNNRLKRGEMQHVSILFNGFETKAKYGYGYGNYSGYGYGYGYGYGAYSNGYHDDKKPSWKQKLNYWIKRWKKS